MPNVAQGDHPKASSSQVAPVGKGPKSGGGGGGGPKVYQSPQILTRCEPNLPFQSRSGLQRPPFLCEVFFAA